MSIYFFYFIAMNCNYHVLRRLNSAGTRLETPEYHCLQPKRNMFVQSCENLEEPRGKTSGYFLFPIVFRVATNNILL